MINKDLTIVINTFKSSDKIFKCLDSIGSSYKIIVVENSSDTSFKKNLEKKYKNVNCFLTNKNLGYAKGNNFGLNLVKTKFSLILNPDTILRKDSLANFFKFSKQYKFFSIVGPYDKDKTNFKSSNKPYEVNNIKGFAMFLRVKDLKKIGFFDKNFFIYCEEIDLCKRAKKNNKKIFIDPKIKIHHLGGSSHNKLINFKMELSRNWHWMWSQFYFNKKHYGYFYSFIKFFPKLIFSFIKFFFYSMLFNKKKLQIYFHRFMGLLNSMILRSSFYRPKV